MDERNRGENDFSSDVNTGTESSRVSTVAFAVTVAFASSSAFAAGTFTFTSSAFASSAFTTSTSNLFTARSRLTRTLLTILYG
jgi:hypothetical protein